VHGGKFASGFISAGISEAALAATAGVQSPFERGALQALIGGTASAASGGKFVNGAVTSAMAFAFNSLVNQDGFEGGSEKSSGMNAEEYLEAVKNGLWKDAQIVDGFSNNSEVRAAAAAANASAGTGVGDVVADPRYIEFLKAVGPATARAKLHSSVVRGQGEKYLALSIN